MKKYLKTELHDNYLEVSLKGDIEFEEYAELIKKVAFQDNLPKNLRVLGIDEGLNIMFKPSDAILLAEIRKQTIQKFNTVRHAFVVNNPENTALAVLTTSAIEDPNYSVKIFSNKENALAWLLT